jgi:hypothetical protein
LSNRQSGTRSTAKPPLRWTGVLFAFAANLLLVTLAGMLISRLWRSPNLELLATVAAPLLAGVLTALYTQKRGAVHAFLGGILSLPILALFVFPIAWTPAILAAAFCTLGGAFTELAMRRQVHS